MSRKLKRAFVTLVEGARSLFANSEHTRVSVEHVCARMDQLYALAKRGADTRLRNAIEARQAAHANPFSRFGAKCFSQSDEDGLTLEIIRRLGLSRGVFVEIGVGDGRENNTLILLAAGWRGVWLGAEDLAFDPSGAERLRFAKTWVTLDNVLSLTRDHLALFEATQADVLSVDVDGNDFYLCEALLTAGFRPELFIVEYNAKFPPGIEFVVPYAPDRGWAGDDFFGASLLSLATLFATHGYKLVCCNAATGANAFFVKAERFHLFPETPTDLRSVYAPPHYDLLTQYGHPASLDTIRHVVMSPPTSP